MANSDENPNNIEISVDIEDKTTTTVVVSSINNKTWTRASRTQIQRVQDTKDPILIGTKF